MVRQLVHGLHLLHKVLEHARLVQHLLLEHLDGDGQRAAGVVAPGAAPHHAERAVAEPLVQRQVLSEDGRRARGVSQEREGRQPGPRG